MLAWDNKTLIALIFWFKLCTLHYVNSCFFSACEGIFPRFYNIRKGYGCCLLDFSCLILAEACDSITVGPAQLHHDFFFVTASVSQAPLFSSFRVFQNSFISPGPPSLFVNLFHSSKPPLSYAIQIQTYFASHFTVLHCFIFSENSGWDFQS